MGDAASEKALGTDAYKKKDFETALKHYNAAHELDPTNMVYKLNIAAVLLEMKEYDKCIEACTTAAEIGTDNKADFKMVAKAYARKAKACTGKGDLAGAIGWYDKALVSHRFGDYLKAKKAVEKQLKEQERLAYLDPAKALEAKDRGNALVKAGDYPAAVSEYSEAIKRDPENSRVYSNRAHCYTKLARFDIALKDAEECIRLDPAFIKGYLRKGNALLGMNKASEALQAFEQALGLDSTNADGADGVRRARAKMYGEGMSQEERVQQAMKDPEIQGILGDPIMQQILQQMQEDPSAVQHHLQNPEIRAKIEKLMQSGILSVGSRPS